MRWIWQQPEWPSFSYNPAILQPLEEAFLHHSGRFFGAYSHLDATNKEVLHIELITNEATQTSEIEGEYLDRNSIQSSICRQLGLTHDSRSVPPAEKGIAMLMVSLYQQYPDPLDHHMLYHWHQILLSDRRDITTIGAYRTGQDPMRVVSGTVYAPKIHFEAPSSPVLFEEMTAFITWFNHTAPNGPSPLPALTRAGITHLYFECIHPFEDGNGRLGRALSEKALAQALNSPSLIALSTVINRKRKNYYTALENANKNCNIEGWLVYFANTILEALHHTNIWIAFLIEKAHFFERLSGQLTPRQTQVLLRMFQEGPEGFKGGLSAENYMRIAKTSRPTTSRDLSDLVQKGALRRSGEKKGTRYTLNSTATTPPVADSI